MWGKRGLCGDFITNGNVEMWGLRFVMTQLSEKEWVLYFLVK